MNLQKDIDKAKKQEGLPSVFLGGSCNNANAWRKNIKDDFKGQFFFIDPYDPDWDPEENIYEELAAILNSDHIIFYQGGKGSAREKKFLENVDKGYNGFDDMNDLRNFLRSKQTKKIACVSDLLKNVISKL